MRWKKNKDGERYYTKMHYGGKHYTIREDSLRRVQFDALMIGLLMLAFCGAVLWFLGSG